MTTSGCRLPHPGIALFVLVCALLPGVAAAEPVATIRINGDPANRVDIVVLGDGYTASELPKFASDAETSIQALFAQDPWREYQRYFNVHRVDVASPESGADHPESTPPVYRDTFFDATYNCAGIPRLICVDNTQVDEVLSRSLPPGSRDVILVLVNDAVYGGSGGSISVASMDASSIEVVLHELGHSFGLLADEYGGSDPPYCDATQEPPEANVTGESQPSLIKWAPWILPSTPLPTPGTEPGVPGLYEGAKYCSTGLFRPTYDSKMRTLYRPYEQINSEQLIKRVYNGVSLIDSSTPSEPTLVLPRGATQVFQIDVPSPLSHTLSATWRVDGQPGGSGTVFALNTSALAPGDHTVEAEVRDPTLMVMNDPSGLLTDRRPWALTVTVSANVTLGIVTAGNGTGTVTSSPAGISCGLDCAEAYPNGTSVTLTPTPAGGSIFSGWSGGGCTGKGPCSLTLAADTTVTATFTRVFALTVTKKGTGSGTVVSSPAGIQCGSVCSAAFSTQVTLVATASSGSRFTGWSGACNGTKSTCQLTMNAAKAVTATFSRVRGR
ncbi:MAG TPA: M64 family metallopeptidase [Candidatus Methylomirabilis sp.]|nr:M64 family metallopeptidase [Candidatus Methylomirabilis sp.]